MFSPPPQQKSPDFPSRCKGKDPDEDFITLGVSKGTPCRLRVALWLVHPCSTLLTF
jgi:hypothetical protein